MDFTKLCDERFSVRSFSDRKVEEEKISQILELVRKAPTAKNNQPYEIYVAKTDSALRKIKSVKENIFNAQLVFVICSDGEKAWRNPFSGTPATLQDIGIIATTTMYACQNFGVDNIYVCAFDPAKMKDVLNLSDNLLPECLILAGYKTEDCEPSPRHFERREIKDFVHEIE